MKIVNHGRYNLLGADGKTVYGVNTLEEFVALARREFPEQADELIALASRPEKHPSQEVIQASLDAIARGEYTRATPGFLRRPK